MKWCANTGEASGFQLVPEPSRECGTDSRCGSAATSCAGADAGIAVTASASIQFLKKAPLATRGGSAESAQILPEHRGVAHLLRHSKSVRFVCGPGMGSASFRPMRTRLQSRFIAALLAPALIASGAAQGMLLMRCGQQVRTSCCCPKGDAPPAAAVKSAALQCCDTLAVPAAPAQATNDRAAVSPSGPVLVATAGEVASLHPVAGPALHVPRLDPPPGLSPILANCALLI